MFDLQRFVQAAHDQTVEVCLLEGFFSTDDRKNRRLFAALQSIIWTHMHALKRHVEHAMVCEFAKTLAHDRAARFRIFTVPSRS